MYAWLKKIIKKIILNKILVIIINQEISKCLLKWLLAGYLLYGKVDVAVHLHLCVDSVGILVLVALQEKVLECRCVFLLKRHNHLVTQSKHHQLIDRAREHRHKTNELKHLGKCREAVAAQLE